MSYGTPPPPPPGQPPYGWQPAYGGQPPYGPPATGNPGTLDLPWYGIGFVDALKRFFQKYARFDGRASRGEYWWATLGLLLVWVPLYAAVFVISAVGTTTTSSADSSGYSTTSSTLSATAAILVLLVLALFAVAVLALLVPSIAISVRRLHDAGFSGWLYLLSFVPCVGLAVLVLLCLPSKPEGARYDRIRSAPPGFGGPAASPYGG